MREGMEKKLFRDLLTHPASVFYKDEALVILIPSTKESLAFHMRDATGFKSTASGVRIRNDDDKYVVQTRKNETFLIQLTEMGWQQHTFALSFAPKHYSEWQIVKRYPSLKIAFETHAKKMGCLPWIDNPTEEDIETALKADPANMRHVKKPSEAKKRKYLKKFPRTFEYMQQNPDLVRYAMENTEISLGEISSQFCSKSICKMGIRKNAHDIKYVPNHHKTKDIILLAIRQNPSVIRELSNVTLDMYVAAVKAGKDGWTYVPESMKKKVRKAL